MTGPRPTDITYTRAHRLLTVCFDDGARFDIPAELLRVSSPSAEVQGHAPDQRKLVPGRSHVGIMEIEPVGNYAIRLVFDDLHDTGIYSWEYLRALGERKEALLDAYLAELEAAGLSRYP